MVHLKTGVCHFAKSAPVSAPVSSCAHYGSCAQHSGTNGCEESELVAFDVVCKVVRLCGCVRL